MSRLIEKRMRDDRGVVGGADVLLFGLVGVVFTSLVIFNAWIAVDTSLAVSAAAREGARAFVESDPGDAHGRGEAAMRAVMTQYGHDAASTTYDVSNPDGFVRCAEVITTANHQINLLSLPFFGDLGSHTITATHSERIDPFRSGDFQGACP